MGLIGRLLLSLALTVIPLAAFGYEDYPVDLTPFTKSPELSTEWKLLKSQILKETPQQEAQLKRLLELAETLSARAPDWVDMQWMTAEAAFQLGSIYQKPGDRAYARSIFVRGLKAAERCEKRKADHPICKLFLGAMLGKIASIDGIFASVRKAKQIETLWLDVTKTQYNYRFNAHSTLQGSTRYALGIFYRLVPDFALVQWLFGVRGDIEKSISFHADSVAVDGSNVCNELMLGAALLCASKGKKENDRFKSGMEHLATAKGLPVTNSVTKACQNDVPALMSDPALACGYETSRQQDLNEKDLPK